MKFCLTLLILILLQVATGVGRSELLDEQLQDLVDASTLTFTGTIVEKGSNVSSITSEDFPIIVQVDKVESATDNQALQKFGDLKKAKLTVAVNPTSRNGLRENISATFFADPLVYEKNIGVTAIAIPIPSNKQDFVKRLEAAAFRKSEAPLRTEVGTAELIITGEIVAVRALAGNKADDLRKVNNGWEVFSEHRPRWMEAIIKVARRLDKPEPKPDFVSVVFPTAHDCFLGESRKFETKDSGIWLLHRDQLDKEETKVLLLEESEKFDGSDVQSYTALRPADFKDISMLSKLQQIIAERPTPTATASPAATTTTTAIATPTATHTPR
jgi:hypothetical protein